MAKRYFTVDQANEMVPALEAVFSRVFQIRVQLKALYQRLESEGHAPDEEDFEVEVPGAPTAVIRLRATLKGLVETLRDEVGAIQGRGCVVKDLEVGLVDWYARVDERDILLCWRYGEKEVSFWHDVDSGFAGRRPVSEL